MQTRKLGREGPDISVIGYGAWEIGGAAYGPNPSDDDVVEVLHSAIGNRIDWIDTAEVYGKGESERLVGKAVSTRRDEVKIATKVAPPPMGSGFEPDSVRRAFEQSQGRLGLEHIDLYQLHWWPVDDDEDYPIEKTWEAMVGLKEQGLVSAVGVSNFTREQIERCLKVGHVDSLQPQFSLLHRKHEELIAWCGEQQIGCVVYGPLAYGLLTGAIDENTEFSEEDWRSGRDPQPSYYKNLFAPGRLEENLEVVSRLRAIADEAAVTCTQLALAWTLSRPGVTSAICGSRNRGHIAENASAGDLKLDPGVLEEVGALTTWK